MIEAEQLHYMFHRPFREPAAIGTEFRFKFKRARTGPFGWAADPETASGGAVKRVASESAVAKDAIAICSIRNLHGRVQTKLLEFTDLFRRDACFRRHLFQLDTMVESKTRI